MAREAAATTQATTTTYEQMRKRVKRQRRINKDALHGKLALLRRDVDVFVQNFDKRLAEVAQMTFYEGKADFRSGRLATKAQHHRGRRGGCRVQRSKQLRAIREGEGGVEPRNVAVTEMKNPLAISPTNKKEDTQKRRERRKGREFKHEKEKGKSRRKEQGTEEARRCLVAGVWLDSWRAVPTKEGPGDASPARKKAADMGNAERERELAAIARAEHAESVVAEMEAAVVALQGQLREAQRAAADSEEEKSRMEARVKGMEIRAANATAEVALLQGQLRAVEIGRGEPQQATEPEKPQPTKKPQPMKKLQPTKRPLAERRAEAAQAKAERAAAAAQVKAERAAAAAQQRQRRQERQRGIQPSEV